MKIKPTLGIPKKDMALTRRYGEIGISAVAAAVRYQGKGKNEISPEGSPTKRRYPGMNKAKRAKLRST